MGNEWIEWHGGECPVSADTRVDVRFRSGKEQPDDGEGAGSWTWKRWGGQGEIIAYRIAAMPDLGTSQPHSLRVLSLIRQWGHDRNLIVGSDPKSQCLKAQSELGELADAILKQDREGQIDGIGDVVVCLTLIAEQIGVTIEQCIEHAYQQIKDRKGRMINNTFVKDE